MPIMKLKELKDRKMNGLAGMYNYRGIYGNLALEESSDIMDYLSDPIEFRTQDEDSDGNCKGCGVGWDYNCTCEPIYVKFPKTTHELALLYEIAYKLEWELEKYKGGWTAINNMIDTYVVSSQESAEEEMLIDITEQGFVLSDGRVIPYWMGEVDEKEWKKKQDIRDKRFQETFEVSILEIKDLSGLFDVKL